MKKNDNFHDFEPNFHQKSTENHYFLQPTAHVALLDLDTRAARFTVWTAMYNRFDAGLQPRERLEDITMASMEHVGVLESHVAQLRTRLAELK